VTEPAPPSAETGLPDGEARARALDSAHSFIVQAPAGSGKTGLLIQRYLALLAGAERPEEILAITFTRKAAGEMRERVLGALEAASGPAPADPQAQRTHALARRALARDRAQGWALRDNPGRLGIQTIDALCLGLVRRMPWLARFGAEPRVLEDARPCYRRAARNLLAALGEDVPWEGALGRVLAHLDNDPVRLESMLASLLARRDQWLRHVAGAYARPGERRAHLEAALVRSMRDALAAARAALPREWVQTLVAVAREAGGNLAAAGADSPLRACSRLRGLPGTTPDDAPAWRGLAELLLKADGTWRRRHDARLGLGASSHARTAAMRAAAGRLCAALTGDETLRARLHAVRALPASRYEDAQWAILEALCELLMAACAELRVTFGEQGRVDFTEVAQAAVQALGEEEAPTDLALVLDYRIRHLLVDEFQDTSQSQFELLRRLTAGWTPGDGRTLFLVGDPMQSIYRFREADVGLYLRAWEHGVGALAPERLRLEANFRARPGLVAWANRTFPRVFPSHPDVDTGAVPWSGSQPRRGAAPGAAEEAVQIHALAGDADEGGAVLGVVEALRRDHPEQGVAVLVRSRGHAAHILPRLRAAGLVCRSQEVEALSARPVVQDLLALTRALVHPADRVAWLAVLRAPWCGVALHTLHRLAGDDSERTLAECLRERAGVLTAEERARLEPVRRVLEGALAERGRASLARRVEGAWCALGGPACVGTEALADARAYVQRLDQLEPAEAQDPVALTAHVEELFASAEAGEADVEVMTIHKAKGLEFDNVLVPGLGAVPRRDDPPLLLWAERTAVTGERDLLLAPIAEAAASADPVYARVRALEQAKTRHETARLMYVAATRARERLHLFARLVRDERGGGWQRPPAGSLLAALWEGIAEDLAPPARAVPAAAEPPAPAWSARARPSQPLGRVAAGWRPPAPPAGPAWRPAGPEPAPAGEARVPFDWAGRSARAVGVLVHRMLRVVAREGACAWDASRLAGRRAAWRASLAGLGVAPAELDAACARVEQALGTVLGDPRGRWLVDPGHWDARAEYALTGVVDGRLENVVIDRTFVDESGVRWIVDYKTGTHEGGGLEAFLAREQARYAPQLERYARLMRAREGGRPVRLGLYFPLIGAWREWAASLSAQPGGDLQ